MTVGAFLLLATFGAASDAPPLHLAPDDPVLAALEESSDSGERPPRSLARPIAWREVPPRRDDDGSWVIFPAFEAALERTPPRLSLARGEGSASARVVVSPAWMDDVARPWSRELRRTNSAARWDPMPLGTLDLSAHGARWGAATRMAFGHHSVHRSGSSRGDWTWPLNGKDFFTRTRFASDAAYARYETADFALVIGRERLKWGPGFTGSLLLDAEAGPLDLLLVTGHPLGTRADVFVAQISALPGATLFGTGPVRPRYLAGHRIEATLGRLVVGAGETAVFADRFVWLYANPVVPYLGVQHIGGANSNIVFALDAELSGPPPAPLRVVADGSAVYGQLLLDDFKLWEKLPHEGGGILGGRLNSIGGIHGLSLRAEAVHVSRRSYTHAASINVHADALGRGLGHPAGPDAQRFAVEARLTPPMLDLSSWSLSLAVRFEAGRNGAGSLATPWVQDQVRKMPAWPFRASSKTWSTDVSFDHPLYSGIRLGLFAHLEHRRFFAPSGTGYARARESRAYAGMRFSL